MTTITIGLDVGDRWSELCVLDAADTVRATRRVRTTPAALEHWFGAQPVSRVVLAAPRPRLSRAGAYAAHQSRARRREELDSGSRRAPHRLSSIL